MNPGWQTFDHVADIGVRGIGRTLDEAFEYGAKALFSIMVENLDEVEPRLSRRVDTTSFDLVGLFVAWLNALISMSDVEGLVFSKFEPKVDEKALEVKALGFGEALDRRRHRLGIEVKGATFSEARVERIDGLWLAQCVVDV